MVGSREGEKTRSIEEVEKRLKFIAPLRNERTDATSDHTDYLGLENIQSWTGKLLLNTSSDSSESDDSASGTANVFYSGDVLFGKLRPYLAKAIHTDKDGVCSTELLVLKPQPDIHPRFLLYSMLAPDFVGLVDASTFGAKMPRANWDFISSIKLPVPAYETQHLIADYLDRETAQIDALLAEKKIMLALLEEKRAALISSTVTRGLSPNALLKHSGLDWLGDIPMHWEIWKLKHVVFKIGSGITPRGGAESYQTEGVPLLRSQNIHFDGLRMDDIVFIDDETHESMTNSKVSNGDVLINITGASIGRCFYVEDMQGEANVNQHVCIIRPLEQIQTKFLYFTLRSEIGQHQINLSQSGSGREGLNFESLGNFIVLIPPLNEQVAITQYLEISGQRSSVLLAEIRNSIDLLKERRAALITAAVAGQISIEEMRS
ncbi:MAG: restriction endonuclease subunit S [Methylobacter sp.]|jgi:type I restriction enzyme S subunit|uniref:restriction endonuclease subunit S n=1 Tax=Methylobacter sp. TaxID=2051955 RepID=UPI0025EADCBC|nr:restriction endonuclease subunit S [Methylobacter sp.]MCK9620264.1 restriction endonuclease subunit S [Methylobacter sp.]